MIDLFTERKARMNRFKVWTSAVFFISKLLVKHFWRGKGAPNQPLTPGTVTQSYTPIPSDLSSILERKWTCILQLIVDDFAQVHNHKCMTRKNTDETEKKKKKKKHNKNNIIIIINNTKITKITDQFQNGTVGILPLQSVTSIVILHLLTEWMLVLLQVQTWALFHKS